MELLDRRQKKRDMNVQKESVRKLRMSDWEGECEKVKNE